MAPGGAIYLTVNGALGCSANVSLGIAATTPTVSLSSPSNNQVFLNDVPQFSGVASTAFDAPNTVTVSVYSSSTGSLVQTLTTAAGPGGSFSVAPSGPLPNGLYSAVASQDDPLGQTNNSAPVTFTLGIVAPPVTLKSLGGAPLTSSSPTFKGRAGTRSVDASSVTVSIYPGASASGSPVQSNTGAVNSDGSCSVPVSSPLADGSYTAVARQSTFGTVGSSGPVTFRRQGAWPIPVRGSTWTGTWPVRLPYGRYTATVTQTDDAGHTTATGTHTFRLLKTPRPRSASRSRSAARAWRRFRSVAERQPPQRAPGLCWW